MATLFVDKLDPQSGTSLEIGTSGDTITVPTGVTVAGGVANTPSFQASLTGSHQSVATSTETVITMNTESYDEGGCYNNTSGTVTLNGISDPAYSFAPNVAGEYLIVGKLQDLTGAGNYDILVYFS